MTLQQLIVLNVLWIWGFYVACKVEFNDDEFPSKGYDKDSRMFLWRIKKWSLETVGTYWAKPICTCPPCMSSLHSIPFFILFGYPINGNEVLMWITWFVIFWPVYVISLCAINYFVSLLINYLDK